MTTTMDKSKIYIENYSDKSFVIKGETTPFKEELKQLGGKWNSRLTEKTTGEKFGAWLFWSDKKEEIKLWLSTGKIIQKPVSSQKTIASYEKRIEKLESMMDKIIKELQNLKGTKETISTSNLADDISDDEENIIPPKRFLKK